MSRNSQNYDSCVLPLSTASFRYNPYSRPFFKARHFNSLATPMHSATQIIAQATTPAMRTIMHWLPSSLVAGNPQLNLVFVVTLFEMHPGLEPLDEHEAKDYDQAEDFDVEGECEARAYTLWLNSLEVDLAVFNLFEKVKDGLIILQASDKVLPGSGVECCTLKPKVGARLESYAGGAEEDEDADIVVTPDQSTLSHFKAVDSTNYAEELAKQNSLHMVGIESDDIGDGKKTLVLGLVWQLNTAPLCRCIQHITCPSISHVFLFHCLYPQYPLRYHLKTVINAASSPKGSCTLMSHPQQPSEPQSSKKPIQRDVSKHKFAVGLIG